MQTKPALLKSRLVARRRLLPGLAGDSMSAIENEDLDERQRRGIDRQTALTPEDAEGAGSHNRPRPLVPVDARSPDSTPRTP